MILHNYAIFFCKKLRFSYILQVFLFGIGIRFWAVENLGSSHHASVVRARNLTRELKNQCTSLTILQKYKQSQEFGAKKLVKLHGIKLD
jgi:hypothetical protein